MNPASAIAPADRYAGCLLGAALGDSLLLPAEGLTRTTIARRFPGPLRQRLVLGRGMVSDDTEHLFLTANALLVAGGEPTRFAAALARRLRWWLLSLPGGIGRATLRGLLRSWIGFSPDKSGVFPAPGNGPAMRSALIGLRFAHDPQCRSAFVHATTAITHRDPLALTGAAAVAEAAAWIANGEAIDHLWSAWRACGDAAWQTILATLERHLRDGATVDDVAHDLGCPHYVRGTAMLSVPIALYAWLRHRHDPEACLGAILTCGGDTDTMGAMAGALLGSDDGPGIFPAPWTTRLWAWPLGTRQLSAAAAALAQTAPDAVAAPIAWSWPLQLPRNLLFLVILIAHVARRRLWPW